MTTKAELRDALRRDPAQVSPTRGQVHAAWRWISRVYWTNRDLHFFAGMYAAAEWTLSLTAVRPVAPYAPDYTPPAEGVRTDAFGPAGDELDLITGVMRGERSVRGTGMDYVSGAQAWLLWWVGATEVPIWLEERQQRKSA